MFKCKILFRKSLRRGIKGWAIVEGGRFGDEGCDGRYNLSQRRESSNKGGGLRDAGQASSAVDRLFK